jgi:sulfotransferase famil protein
MKIKSKMLKGVTSGNISQDFEKVRKYIRDLENPLIFDSEHKFIYFPINKNAQTSIARNILGERCIVRKDNTLIWESFFETKLSHAYFNDCVKFGIVRNPFDRFISAYQYLNNRRKLPKHKKFDDFVEKHFLEGNGFYHPVFQEQHLQLYYKDNLMVDVILRFENLNDEWTSLARRIGCSEDLPHKNSTQKKNLMSYYSDETLKLIGDYYQEDFTKLNYPRLIS